MCLLCDAFAFTDAETHQIAEAYRRWGITPATKDVVVVKVVFPTADRPEPPTAEHVWSHLSEHVKGTPAALADAEIAKATDWPKVRKYYKLNGAPVLEGIKGEPERAKELEALVLSGMALKGI